MEINAKRAKNWLISANEIIVLKLPSVINPEAVDVIKILKKKAFLMKITCYS